VNSSMRLRPGSYKIRKGQEEVSITVPSRRMKDAPAPPFVDGNMPSAYKI
jgi:hypothetical protein